MRIILIFSMVFLWPNESNAYPNEKRLSSKIVAYVCLIRVVLPKSVKTFLRSLFAFVLLITKYLDDSFFVEII